MDAQVETKQHQIDHAAVRRADAWINSYKEQFVSEAKDLVKLKDDYLEAAKGLQPTDVIIEKMNTFKDAMDKLDDKVRTLKIMKMVRER